MDYSNVIQGLGVNIGVVVLIIGIVAKLRKSLLDDLVKNKVRSKKLVWIILIALTLFVSLSLTAIALIVDFNLLEYIKQSFLNWVFSWVCHDAVKKLFYKSDKG